MLLNCKRLNSNFPVTRRAIVDGKWTNRNTFYYDHLLLRTHKAHKSTSHRTALTQILISMQAEWYTTVSRFNGTCIFHLIYNWMWWWWCSQQTVHAFMLINDVIFIIIKCETKRTRSTPTLLFAVWVHCIVCTLLSAPSLCQFKWFTLLWCCKHNHGIFSPNSAPFFQAGILWPFSNNNQKIIHKL